MTAFVGPRATATFPLPQAIQAGTMQIWRGHYDITVNPVAADTYDLCWVPAGAVIVGGFMYLDDIDTNATETFDMDMGWLTNGGSGTYDATDADGLGNFGVMNGDAFAAPSISSTAGNIVPLSGILADGIFPYFTKKTLIRATCVATCATFTAGRLSVAVYGDWDPSLVA